MPRFFPSLPSPAFRTRLPLIAWTVLIVCLLLTLAATYLTRRIAQTQQSLRFQMSAQTVSQSVSERFRHSEDILYVVEAMFRASESVDETEWKQFTDALEPSTRYPGVLRLGYITATRTNGQITQRTVHREFPIVESIAPIMRDLSHDPEILVSLNRACDTGMAISLPRHSLAPEDRPNSRMLMFMPVYKGSSSLFGAAARRKALMGWTYVELDVETMMRDSRAGLLTTVDLSLYQGSEVKGEKLVYFTGNFLGSNSLKFQSTFQVGGIPWTVQCLPNLGFVDRAYSHLPTSAAIAGVTISTIAFLLIWSLGSTRLRAEKLAHEMTATLRLSQAELSRAKSAAESANQAKSQFLANMSHEIRTPLNGILGTLDLLMKTHTDDKQKRYLQASRTSAATLRELIDDLLDFSKIEAGKMELEQIEFDLPELLRQMLDLFEPTAQKKNLELRLDLDALPSSRFKGDPTRLRQILQNLVSNALKFTHEGSVTVEVRSQVLDTKPAIKFAVHDTGRGIPQDRMNRLFQSFSQVDESTTRKHGGTGLGLAICKQLTQMMGGTIGVDPVEGVGTTFWCVIPLPLPAAENVSSDPLSLRERATVRADETNDIISPIHINHSVAPRPDPLPEGDGARLTPNARILIVEDNEINRLVATELLTRAGYQITLAHDGQQAVDALAKNEFDLVLMDCQMPVLDGYAATRAIRAKEQSTRTPIVALTASALPEDHNLCREAGMDGLLTKPLDPDQLVSTIESFLNKHRDQSTPPPINVSEMMDRCLGDPKFAELLLHKFEEQVKLAESQLEQALAAHDADQTRKIAHAIKGAASQISAANIAKLAEELETLGRENHLDAAAEPFKQLSTEIATCLDFVPRVLKSSSEHPEPA